MNSLTSNRINAQEESIIHAQAELFARSAKDNIPSGIFTRVFMLSDETKTLDIEKNDYSTDIEILYYQICQRIKPQRGIVYPPELLHWVGYMYRYWAISDNISSNTIYKRVPFKKMLEFYNAGHTVDPSKALEMIKDSVSEVTSDEIKDLIRKYYHYK